MALSTQQFNELLAKAKALAAKRKEEENEAAISSIEDGMVANKTTHVDLDSFGITQDSIQTLEGREQAVEIISEVASAPPANVIGKKVHTTGVAADVTLNEKQREFIETALSGEDICLIGAAGTGKTTVTGKFIAAALEEGIIGKMGSNTKWLRDTLPGLLITSFTRKAVNNIRRAVPPELQDHVLTMHKVLEFAPEYYEIADVKTQEIKKTMRFIPTRTALNPLPTGLLLIVYEESSMIGTDLYNMMSAATPHNPQEIFIGDIRQLPPIFGPAILGFKMSLLPIVELTDVYRQAMLSPIIRLAHSVLSGDARLFFSKTEEREEIHHTLGKKLKRKFVPALEKYNEEGEYGSVKIQIWQKKLSDELGCATTIQQFNAWEKTGYYNPQEDIILCPFNKSFGTIELNKGISQHLGLKRQAVVHEVIARRVTHYLAIGDRVLYDKEDAFIVDIKRNMTYLGKSPQASSIYLDRWGILQHQLSEEEQLKLAKEEQDFETSVMDKFMDISSDDDEDATNVASHSITIRFSYSDEEMILSKAGEVNQLLGGYALTVHKMQGSEAEKIFFVLHHSHAMMVQNELLYTGITRARKFLHIICEVDTFFKGVKSHKVRGITLADKIDFFKGKVEFKAMQEEMEFLKKQREDKKKKLENTKARIAFQNELENEIFGSNQEEKEEELEYEPDIEDYTSLLPDITDYDDTLGYVYDELEREKTREDKMERPVVLETSGAPESHKLSIQDKLSQLRASLLGRNKR